MFDGKRIHTELLGKEVQTEVAPAKDRFLEAMNNPQIEKEAKIPEYTDDMLKIAKLGVFFYCLDKDQGKLHYD